MAVRALRARIDCDHETLLHLWRTHRVFNERLPSLLTKLFAMRRGDVGQSEEQRALYSRFTEFLLARDAKDAPYLLNAVSISGWKPKSALDNMKGTKAVDADGVEFTVSDWALHAAALSGRGVLAFDKARERHGLPDSLYNTLTRDAVAYISGHDQLVKRWQSEHEAWLTRKMEWEGKDEHRQYLALRKHFDAFEESVGGQAGKRRARWHLYLSWLSENPDLAAWRGGPAKVQALDDAAKERVRRAKPWKQRSVEAEEFWIVNPELAALDRLHGYYEREFVRRRKSKKHPDGFDHRPTFTLPHPVLHPRWALFNAPQTKPPGYRDLRLPGSASSTGSVALRLLTGDKDGNAYPNAWVTVRFRADPRLAMFVERSAEKTIKSGAKKGQTKTVSEFRFRDPQLGRERDATISGAKIIFKDIRLNPDGSLKSATPYIVFACRIESLPFTEKAKAIQWSETGEVTKTGKKRKRKKLPQGIVSCAVDLGLRNVGFLTLAQCAIEPDRQTHSGVSVLRARNEWLVEQEADHAPRSGRPPGGPDLAHIGRHKREIRRMRRLRGKPVRGERSHVRLQRHIDNMGQDRFKKAARAIVNFALNTSFAAEKATGEVFPRADVLLVEKLAGFIPDAERERGVNRALVAWNRGQLVTRIKEMAVDAGLKVFEVYPVGTSQCCSRCGALGRRYSIARDDSTGRPAIRFGWVEKLFACPECGYRANADHNASVNLHRRFAIDDAAVAAFFAWRNLPETRRRRRIEELDAALLPALIRLHALGLPDPATPF